MESPPTFIQEKREENQKDKEWSTIGEKGFGSRLLAREVLAPRMSVMKMTVFNRVC